MRHSHVTAALAHAVIRLGAISWFLMSNSDEYDVDALLDCSLPKTVNLTKAVKF